MNENLDCEKKNEVKMDKYRKYNILAMNVIFASYKVRAASQFLKIMS